MQSHNVNLMGRDFKVRSEDTVEHVEAVATYVNDVISGLSEGRRHTPVQQVLLLASMTMADELLKERARLEAIREKIRAQSRALLARL